MVCIRTKKKLKMPILGSKIAVNKDESILGMINKIRKKYDIKTINKSKCIWGFIKISPLDHIS